MNFTNKMRENSETKKVEIMRSDLRKRELTSLIYFILSPLNSNSLSQRENENENENEWENCTKRDSYWSLDLWAPFLGPGA